MPLQGSSAIRNPEDRLGLNNFPRMAELLQTPGGICGRSGGKTHRVHACFATQEPVIKLLRGFTVRKNTVDRSLPQKGGNIVSFRVRDTCVGASADTAGGDDVLERDPVCQKKTHFLLGAWRNVHTVKGRCDRPEPVARIAVIEFNFPGFYGRECTKDQNLGVIVPDGRKRVKQQFRFHSTSHRGIPGANPRAPCAFLPVTLTPRTGNAGQSRRGADTLPQALHSHRRYRSFQKYSTRNPGKEEIYAPSFASAHTVRIRAEVYP